MNPTPAACGEPTPRAASRSDPQAAARLLPAAPAAVARRLCVAPMMDWTDRHCRYFHRLLSRHAMLYTEMVTTPAVLHGDRERLLGFDPAERPLGLQLGGCDPEALARCARLAAQWGYDEVNLNVGCPSERVQTARFGACLMAEPALVGECVSAMRAASGLPVTVKTRLGIDEQDSFEFLAAFVERVRAAGCAALVVHARKAWLSGLSPRENREVPPLDYPAVYRLKRAYPDLEVVINGGIRSLEESEAHLAHVDGVMLGRQAYQAPYVLAEADRRLFGSGRPAPSREEVVEALLPYLEAHLARGGRLAHCTRHILGLFHGAPGARGWRRRLSTEAHLPGAGVEVLRRALAEARAGAGPLAA